MDPLELAFWTDAVYSAIVCSDPTEREFVEFCEIWFKELISHRERREDAAVSGSLGGSDRS